MRCAPTCFLAAAAWLALAWAPFSDGRAAELETEEEKAIYAMGALQAKQLETMMFSPQELEIFIEGFSDAHGGEPRIALEGMLPRVNALRRTRRQAAIAQERKASQAYVEKAAQQEGAVTTDSGLVYIKVREGLGDKPSVLDRVKVHYHGTLRDGTVFDSSRQRGEPATFPLNRVISCWSEGLQMMREGGKAKLICPAEIAYGDRGAGMLIQPGAALTFEVELLEILDSR